jgi:hypothetical protein
LKAGGVQPQRGIAMQAGGGMNITVYGLVGHSGKLELPLESLDVEDLEPGEEFEFEGNLYEIRSVQENNEHIRINVVLSLILGQT